MQAIRVCIAAENLKTIINQTKIQSGFYYHHVLAIVNNVSDKMLLPKRIFCGSSLYAIVVISTEAFLITL